MQRLYSLLLKSSILLVVFTIQGCAPVVYSYPETWPSPLIADDQDCQNISGTYMNAGDTSDETYRKEFLFDMITNEGFMGKHECTNCTVKLAWHNSDLSELSVTLHDSDGLLLEKEVLRREKGDFACENGAVVIEFVVGFEAYVEGVFEAGTRKYFLAVEEKDELLAGGDYWLIQKQHSTAIARMLVVVPFSVTVTRYSRWLKID